MFSFDEEDSGIPARRKRMPLDVVHVLMTFFTNVSETPSMKERLELSRRTGVDQRTIQIWFQNRRSKLRRESSGPSLFAENQRRPVVSSRNFKDLCLPKYLDVPFEQQQTQEERMESEAIRQFWQEQAAINDNSSASNSSIASGRTSRPELKFKNKSKRARLDFSESELLQSLTPIDMPVLTPLNSFCSTKPTSIPLQQISQNPPKLFKDPITKQVYAPQLDPIGTGLDFLFTPTKSEAGEEKSALTMPLQPSASKDIFSWFPELEF